LTRTWFPSKAINLEFGIKGQLGERTRYDLALFRIRTRDEIVQVDTASPIVLRTWAKRAGMAWSWEFSIFLIMGCH